MSLIVEDDQKHCGSLRTKFSVVSLYKPLASKAHHLQLCKLQCVKLLKQMMLHQPLLKQSQWKLHLLKQNRPMLDSLDLLVNRLCLTSL